MGKRIIQQARGHGSSTYRVRRSSFKHKLKYPPKLKGQGTVIKLLNSSGHTAPIAKIKYENGFFYMPAFNKMIEGQKIDFESKDVKEGNISMLKDIPIKTQIYNIESNPRDGGIFIKSAGNSAVIHRIIENDIFVLMP
ncbi:hypothetical protein LCGC14_2689380, partial [marine sediment metagenome]